MIESLYKPFQKWSEKGGIFVFSDPHFEDEDLVNVYDNRPSADELVRRINSKVGKCDTLICLGDVGALSYVPFLRGHKVLVMGNHDAGDFGSDGGDYIRVLDWLEQAGIVDTGYFFHLHTMNPVGRENMERIIRKNGWRLVK